MMWPDGDVTHFGNQKKPTSFLAPPNIRARSISNCSHSSRSPSTESKCKVREASIDLADFLIVSGKKEIQLESFQGDSSNINTESLQSAKSGQLNLAAGYSDVFMEDSFDHYLRVPCKNIDIGSIDQLSQFSDVENSPFD